VRRSKLTGVTPKKLARVFRAGDIEGINIPEAKDEAVRDLCRARTDASQATGSALPMLV